MAGTCGTTRRPRALDLYCCGGGAGLGLAEAGFDVLGVDETPQPEYPGAVVRADVLALDPEWVAGFDFVWASPPCQFASCTRNLYDPARVLDLPDLIAPTRELLDAAGAPYALENVDGAGQRPDLMLCGLMFGLGVARHRAIELGGWTCVRPAHHERCRGRDDVVTVAGSGASRGGFVSLERAREAMGAPHLRSRYTIDQAVPPAYSRWVAGQWLAWAVSSLVDVEWSPHVAVPSVRRRAASSTWSLQSQRDRQSSPSSGQPSRDVGDPSAPAGQASKSAADPSRLERAPSHAGGVASTTWAAPSTVAVRCGCGCGDLVLPPGPEGGRPALYASTACRQRAWRRRTRAA